MFNIINNLRIYALIKCFIIRFHALVVYRKENVTLYSKYLMKKTNTLNLRLKKFALHCGGKVSRGDT